LNCCVTDTKDAPCAWKISTSRAKSASDGGQPVDLVDDDNVSGRPWYRRADLHRRPLQIAAREPAIIITGSGQCLALVELVGGEPQDPQTRANLRQYLRRRIFQYRISGDAVATKCALGLAADAGLDEVLQASFEDHLEMQKQLV
jgi:hypothetical protein